MLKSKTIKTIVVEKHKFHDKHGIKLDPTLLLKLLEFAREEAKTDEQLHSIVSKATSLALEEGTDCLYMDHYKQLIGEYTPPPVVVYEPPVEEVATLPEE